MTQERLDAARRYAPPLIVASQTDRRGARLKSVDRRAVDYARRAGLPLEGIYPEGLDTVRALAPDEGSEEAFAFVRAAGMAPDEVYPTFTGEAAAPKSWKWAFAGFAIGAMAGGPIWALAGAALGALK